MTMDKDLIVHIDQAQKREDLPEYEQGGACPRCGGATEDGFGLAGGGFGIYSFCPDCQAVVGKTEVEE